MSRDIFPPLPLPVPPMLEAALGYEGTAQYVAFYWIPGGDELIWDDGWSSADGEWAGWLTFTRHPRVAPALAPYHFGDSDTPATHWLLLDRETRTCTAGPAQAVQQALRLGNPPPEAPAWTELAGEEPLPALTAEDWQAVVESFRDIQVDVSMAEIEQRLAAHARVLEAMQDWLEAQTPSMTYNPKDVPTCVRCVLRGQLTAATLRYRGLGLCAACVAHLRAGAAAAGRDDEEPLPLEQGTEGETGASP